MRDSRRDICRFRWIWSVGTALGIKTTTLRLTSRSVSSISRRISSVWVQKNSAHHRHQELSSRSIREPDGTWQTAKFADKEIQLQSAGEVLDIRLAKDYDYRLTTKTAGAEVLIAKI